ncbi:MAG: DUF6084 family protein [Chloroflexota bacterium]|nr:DUF6084 family protein [Chloroflexota bacterium]
MHDLTFTVESAAPLMFAAAPLLAFQLRVACTDVEERIESIALHCQIQLEVTRRHYAPEEQARLLGLFGDPERWNQTLRTMLWTHANVTVPSFTGSTVVDLPVPCTYDFNLAATKYFYGLEEGDVPLCLLFSGTIFYRDTNGAMRIGQIPWEKEATFRLPIAVWRAMMDHYYPNTAWLDLPQDVFDRLYEYKSRNGIPTWEQVIARLLTEAEAMQR